MLVRTVCPDKVLVGSLLAFPLNGHNPTLATDYGATLSPVSGDVRSLALR